MRNGNLSAPVWCTCPGLVSVFVWLVSVWVAAWYMKPRTKALCCAPEKGLLQGQVDDRGGDIEVSKRQEILQKHVKSNVALNKTGCPPP